MGSQGIKMGTNTKLITRVALEVSALILLGVGCLYLHKSGKITPYERGFYCDDENIKKPFKEDTVSEVSCFIIWAVISAAILIAVELVSFISHPPVRNDDVKIPPMVMEYYRVMGSFCIGAVFCMLATEMCKVTIGELRPHFLTICNPTLTQELCYQGYDFDTDRDYRRYGMKFVEGINCSYTETISGVKFTKARWEKKVSDARKSIISGHSSFSFYCAVFLTLYLGTRLINLKAKEKFIGTQRRGSLPAFILLISKALRPFIQFGLLATAFYICLSRVSDYKHHPRDVIAGGLFGSLSAYLTFTYIADLSSKPRLVYRNEFDQLDEIDAKSKTVINLETVNISTVEGAQPVERAQL